jgi:hypothetical protein
VVGFDALASNHPHIPVWDDEVSGCGRMFVEEEIDTNNAFLLYPMVNNVDQEDESFKEEETDLVLGLQDFEHYLLYISNPFSNARQRLSISSRESVDVGRTGIVNCLRSPGQRT